MCTVCLECSSEFVLSCVTVWVTQYDIEDASIKVICPHCDYEYNIKLIYNK